MALPVPSNPRRKDIRESDALRETSRPGVVGRSPIPDDDLAASGPLLPWPSLGWQQAALAGAVVLGLIVAISGMKAMVDSDSLGGALSALLCGLGMVALALYAGWTTRWLTRTGEASVLGKVTGWLSIGITVAVAVAVAAAVAILVGLIVLAIWVVLQMLFQVIVEFFETK